MKRYCSILFLVLVFGPGLLVRQEAKAEKQPVLRIRIPREIDTDSLKMISGVYGGDGLGVGPIDTKSGVYDYSVQLGSKAKTVKLLIYAPGYKMVTAEFGVKSISPVQPFAPRFTKLPTTPLHLKVVGSNGEPLANQKITLSHGLATHQYFGYLDGMAFSADLLTATSDNKGEIDAELPLLLEDPYFPIYSLTSLLMSSPNADGDCSPSLLPLRRSYEQPVIVTRLFRAKLSGKITKSFLRRHKVEGDLTPYMNAKRHSPFRVELRAESGDGTRGYNCMLLGGGEFSVVLPIGTYNLHLVVLGKGETLHRKIPVQKNVVLKENENRILVVR
ncbi:MAG: hypothetical protein HY318_05465 [Armatimonadetes bacterium]|nr:hypothetical protein [Armatimonadota bacterium]